MGLSIFNTELQQPWFLLLFLLFIPLIIKDAKKKKSMARMYEDKSVVSRINLSEEFPIANK